MWAMTGMEMWACPGVESDTSSCARKYIKDMQLSKDDVKIVQRGHMTLVIAKRDIPDERSDDFKSCQADG